MSNTALLKGKYAQRELSAKKRRRRGGRVTWGGKLSGFICKDILCGGKLETLRDGFGYCRKCKKDQLIKDSLGRVKIPKHCKMSHYEEDEASRHEGDYKT